MKFDSMIMTAAELARFDYISVARRRLIELGVDPYDAQLGATDCFNSRYRTGPVQDAQEWHAGWTHG